MKKKKTMLIIIGIVVFAIIIGVCLWNQGQKEKLPDVPMPGIAFEYSTTKSDGLYICSDGRIFQAISEEAFYMPKGELIDRMKQGNYGDILEYKGKTSVRKVQEMYNLFTEVVLNQEYFLIHVYMEIPNGGGSHSRERGYWYGYWEENGEIKRDYFYRTDDEMKCSDTRALKIVRWMNRVLFWYK